MKECSSFEEQEGTRYIRGNVYFDNIVFSCVLSTKSCLRFLLIFFALKIEDFYQSSLRNKFDFTDMKVSLALFTIVPKSIIEELNEIQKKFLWSNKKCKIKYGTLCNDYKNGSLKI